MPFDANLALQSATTTTATATSTAVNLPTGTAYRGLDARLIVSAVSGTSPTFTLKWQESTDGTTYIDKGWFSNPATNVNSLTAAGQMWARIRTDKAYVRLISTIGGTNPVYTWKAEIGESLL